MTAHEDDGPQKASADSGDVWDVDPDEAAPGGADDDAAADIPFQDEPAHGARVRGGGAHRPDEPDEEEQIPVIEVTVPAAAQDPRSGGDWTRTEAVRDDPGAMGEEVRKLLGAVRDQFVDPLLRNYPEAAGHLSTAGTEIAAALRALVRGAERRWTDHGDERPDDGRDDRRDQ